MEMPKCTVTVDDSYGQGWWEKHKNEVAKWKTEFRYPKLGEKYLDWYCRPDSDAPHVNPRLVILGPARPTLMEVYGSERVTIPEGHEWIGVFSHIKNPGDGWLSIHGDVCFDDRTDIGFTQPRLILRTLPPAPTIESIYGTPNPVIPDGWVSTGILTGAFEVGEAWLSTAGATPYIYVAQARHIDPADRPRLKLRRVSLADVYGKNEVEIHPNFEWTGEFRRPKADENFVFKNLVGFSGPADRLIIRPRAKKVQFVVSGDSYRPPQKGDWFWYDGTWEQATHNRYFSFLCAARQEIDDLTSQTVTQADIDRLNAKGPKC